MACVKIYLCSNPEDSVVERKVLREDVFPKLREDCRRTYGLDFRIIDPYEGMDPGSWPTQKERLQLLDECRQNSLGPFFVGLVGRQYGGACLPEQVELSEFLTILQVGQQMGCSSAALEKCYRRNENTIPPSFCLLSQHAYQKQHDTHASRMTSAMPCKIPLPMREDAFVMFITPLERLTKKRMEMNSTLSFSRPE
ncbi:NACHT and WD repeat domain-containing protein 2 isoform X2 [Brachyhypopomus gauderio]|uniref:NACHT and WD repeat domain-containing protein 2 isoform X2 n=1 Tax=Brachyhypopomus gauderio TaxID=698409 RepID=UPI004042945F